MRSRALRPLATLLVAAVAWLTVVGCGGGTTTAQDNQLSPSQRRWVNYIADKAVPNLRIAMFQIGSDAAHQSTGAVTGSMKEWNGGNPHLNKAFGLLKAVNGNIKRLVNTPVGTAGEATTAVTKITRDFIAVYNEMNRWAYLLLRMQVAGPYSSDFAKNMQTYSRRYQKKDLKKAMRAVLKEIDAVKAQTQ